jgi:hypothetical protein
VGLIIISSKAQCGKNTLGKMLQEALTEDYTMLAYADELKRRLSKDFGLSRDQLYGNLKEAPDERYVKPDGAFWTTRELMQFIGTDVFRVIDSDFWVKQLFKYINKNMLNNVIITDGRFPNEINAVKKRGGIHIRIERAHDLEVHGMDHASEVSLDNYDNADFVVDNSGTLEELKQKTLEIKKEIENGR